MKKINMKSYKMYKTYFVLFDILLKENNKRKEDVLNELNISISSYRRAHFNDTKLSKVLYIKLCNYFNIIPLDLKDIDCLEEKLNKIYLDNYYGIDSKFNENLKWLEEQTKKRNVLYPIFELLEHYYKFDDIFFESSNFSFIKYKSFYKGELLEFCNVFEIAGMKNLYDAINFNYNDNYNEHYLSALALNSFKNKRYIESIYYAEKAVALYELNLNYKRKYSINLIIMLNLLSLEKYSDCAKLAHKQYYSLISLENFNSEFYLTLELFLISNLYLKKYSEIIKEEYGSYNSNIIVYIKLYAYKKLNDNEGYNKTLDKINATTKINKEVNIIEYVENSEFFKFDYEFVKKLSSYNSFKI